jgi:hypothetical protein
MDVWHCENGSLSPETLVDLAEYADYWKSIVRDETAETEGYLQCDDLDVTSADLADPADQAGIMAVLAKLGANSTLELVRILFVVAMISNEAVIAEIGEQVKHSSFDSLDRMFKERPVQKLPHFRQGSLLAPSLFLILPKS